MSSSGTARRRSAGFAPLGVLAAIALLLTTVPAVAAGEVTVTPKGRHGLVIQGDPNGNDLVVERIPDRDGAIAVRGRNGTTVNGLTAVLFEAPRRIDVDLGEGNDVISFGAIRNRRRVRVDLGPGDDRCEFFACVLKGRTKIIGGPGDDELFAGSSTQFGRSLRVSMDDGADTVHLEDSAIQGRSRVFTGDGADHVKLLRNGVTEHAPLVVRTGRHDDSVHIQGCTFQNGVRVLTVGGQDDVTIMTSHFEEGLFLDTGEDHDEARLEQSSFEGAFKMVGGIRASTGSATLVIVNVTFGIRSDGDDKFTWSVVVIHRFP
jgi:hypothetical protein